MKVSREQFAENREKILEAAGRLFREHGFERVTVAEVMKAAGLTHGGFYGHFKSKNDLIAQTLARSNEDASTLSLVDYAHRYLSRQHCDDKAGGCTIAGLGPEVLHQSPEARAAVTHRVKAQIEKLALGAPGKTDAERRRAAIGGWAAMVGALLLARVTDDAELGDEVLAQTRAWIAEKDGKDQPN